MTRIFFYRNKQSTAIQAGTGKAVQVSRRLKYKDKDIVLGSSEDDAGYVRIGGIRIKEFALFHGDGVPRLLHDTGLIKAIRASRISDRLPASYIDQRGNVVEGQTGKIIFKA